MSTVLVWSIALGTIAGILFRPRRWPEAVWACAGAGLLVLCRLLSPAAAWKAIGKGTDVYLFLAGMMLLAELARREGVFDWLASHAVRAARGSPARLFALVYAVGILVTVFLSNDATAVVLTPAVYAAVKKARAHALPYLLICAFIANAASFVLPISNPANLVVFGNHIPPLTPWLRVFLLPGEGLQPCFDRLDCPTASTTPWTLTMRSGDASLPAVHEPSSVIITGSRSPAELRILFSVGGDRSWSNATLVFATRWKFGTRLLRQISNGWRRRNFSANC